MIDETNNMDGYSSLDRRTFLKNIPVIGSLATPLSFSESFSNNNTQIGNKDGNRFPGINYKAGSMLSRSDGPNLSNQCCRVDIGIDGNPRQFQIIGAQNETQFVGVFQHSETWICFNNSYHRLADADEITFNYELTSVSIHYRFRKLPLSFSKRIFIDEKDPCLIQQITVENPDSKSHNLFILEKVKFTLGDPYYVNASLYHNNGSTGLKLVNELAKAYSTRFISFGPDVKRIFCRDDHIASVLKGRTGAWSDDQFIARNCDDQSAMLQKKITLAAGTSSADFITMIYAGISQQLAAASSDVELIIKINMTSLCSKLDNEARKLCMITTPDKLLDEGFAISNKVLSQVYRTAGGLVALPGHMYSNFYPRDSHWQIKGLLIAGEFEIVRELLNHLIKYQTKDGYFPTRINLAGKPVYHAGAPDLDSAALICMSIMDYVKWTQDWNFASGNWHIIEEAISWLSTKDADGDGWLEQGYNEDWADRTQRHGKVNYTQCVYFRLLTEAAAIGARLGKPVQSYKERSARMKSNYDVTFWDQEEGAYLDYISPTGERMKKLSQDVTLAFIFGLATDKKKIRSHLQQLKQKCWGAWGPAHHEGYKDGNKFDPVGFYCNGGVWMWLTAFEALAHFRFGDPADGVTALNAIKEYEYGKNPYNAVYFDTTEWHDSLNGLNCEHDWKQCRNFTTGSGAHTWSLYAGLFGIETGITGDLDINPHFPTTWQNMSPAIKGIRQGDQLLDISFHFKDSWIPAIIKHSLIV